MDTNKILAELRAERDRIDRAISALENLNSTGRGAAAREPRVTAKKRGRAATPPYSRTRRKPITTLPGCTTCAGSSPGPVPRCARSTASRYSFPCAPPTPTTMPSK